MDRSSPEALLQELYADKWICQAIAAGDLRQYPNFALQAIERLFELCCGDNVALKASCESTIKSLGPAAVPYLLEQSEAAEPLRRHRAIILLSTVGFAERSTCQLATQEISGRPKSMPDWGDYDDKVLAAFHRALSDEYLSVRLDAACALDDFEGLVESLIPIFIDAAITGTVHQQNWAALHLGRIGPPALAACIALMRLATACYNEDDRWSKYANLAAKVALRKIGCRPSV